MSQVLKLVGLKTFVAPFTGAILVQKGEVIRVSDEIAEKLKEGQRNNAEGEPVYYWNDEPKAGEKIAHDFTTEKGPATVGGAPEVKEEQAAPTAARRGRQRSAAR